MKGRVPLINAATVWWVATALLLTMLLLTNVK